MFVQKFDLRDEQMLKKQTQDLVNTVDLGTSSPQNAIHQKHQLKI